MLWRAGEAMVVRRERFERVYALTAMVPPPEALRDVDPEYQAMRLGDGDIAPLAAFLRSLDEVDEHEFRSLLLHFEEE